MYDPAMASPGKTGRAGASRDIAGANGQGPMRTMTTQHPNDQERAQLRALYGAGLPPVDKARALGARLLHALIRENRPDAAKQSAIACIRMQTFFGSIDDHGD